MDEANIANKDSPIEARRVPWNRPDCVFVGLTLTFPPVGRAFNISCFCFVVKRRYTLLTDRFYFEESRNHQFALVPESYPSQNYQDWIKHQLQVLEVLLKQVCRHW